MAVETSVWDNSLVTSGFTVNRLVDAADGACLLCEDHTPVGSPMLAIPLSDCWTVAAAEKECPDLAEIKAMAQARNSVSKLLARDSTWICVHMVYELRRGNAANPARRAQLASLPKEPETLLAWSSADLAALAGTRWRDEAKRRQQKIDADFSALCLELGPEAVAKLKLDIEGYRWAQQILNQFGMQVQGANMSTILVLAPGVERLQPSDSSPSAEGVRIGFSPVDKSPCLMFFAEKDIGPGEVAVLSHGGLQCSNGERLMSCGHSLDKNPWESVEMELYFPVGSRTSIGEDLEKFFTYFVDAVTKDFAGGRRHPDVGECCPPEPFVDELPAQLIVDDGGQAAVKTYLKLSRKNPLPSKAILANVGTLLTCDPSKQEQIMMEEKGDHNVIGSVQSEKRALKYLKDLLTQVLDDYPRSKVVAPSFGRGLLPRSARAQQVINGERQVLSLALAATKGRLVSFAQSQQDVSESFNLAAMRQWKVLQELMASSKNQAADPDTELGKTLAQVKGATQALDRLSSRFLELNIQKNWNAEDGMTLKKELDMLKGSLEGCPLGDPFASPYVPMCDSEDQAVQLHGDLTMALLSAQLASQEWETAWMEHEMQKGSEVRESLAGMMVHTAGIRARLLDFAAAQEDLRRCLVLMPRFPPAMEAARDYAMSAASTSEDVLFAPAGGWGNYKSALQALRHRLHSFGYMRAGARWTWPKRVPSVNNLAIDLGDALGASEEALIEESLGLKAGAQGPVQPKVNLRQKESLQSLIFLFMYHGALPLVRVKKLLGEEACCLLLECDAISCYESCSARLVPAAEAAGLIRGESAPEELEVFANVLLWPIDDDMLVAVDFEQGICSDDLIQPVPYPGEDSRALASCAPRMPPVKMILDACCGSGVQGLVALKHYAKKAVFVDCNPRALRFATFSAHLNGKGDQALFVEGDLAGSQLPQDLEGMTFNAVLAGQPFLPNPGKALTNGAAFLCGGGENGQQMLEGVIIKAIQQLLAPGGRLVATTMLPNAETFPEQLQEWADAGSDTDPANFKAVVFQGDCIEAKELAGASAANCSPVGALVHFREVQQAELHSISEAMLLIWVPPSGVTALPASHARRVELRPQQPRLWRDLPNLQRQVEGALYQMMSTEEVYEILDEGSSGGQSLYSMDWGAAVDDTDAADMVVAQRREALDDGGKSRWQSLRRKAKKADDAEVKQQEQSMMDGCNWKDLGYLGVLGFAPPILADCLWNKTSPPKPKGPLSNFQMAYIEVRGCKLPGEYRNALASIGCRDRLALDPVSRAIKWVDDRGKMSDESSFELEWFDTFLVPLDVGAERSGMLHEVSKEFFFLVKQLIEYQGEKNNVMRIVALTSGTGPPMADGHNELPNSAPIRGFLRCARIETPQVPLMHMDSDLFCRSGSSGEWLTQLKYELDLSTPSKGLERCSVAQFQNAMVQFHREVAYRNGDRFMPRLDVSARNPILGTCQTPMARLPKSVAEGVAIITGGTGGLGLSMAEALVLLGAGTVVLCSRSGKPTRGNQGLDAKLTNLMGMGAKIVLMACDTSDENSVISLLKTCRENYGPLKIIIHAAGITGDPDPTYLQNVMAPKCEGARYINRHTREDAIEHFLMTSSNSALTGSETMGTYAMANTYLDELARRRRAEGFPAVSIMFPEVAEAGMAADFVAVGQSATIPLSVVKRTIFQVIVGKGSVAPVVTILTVGNLFSRTQVFTHMLEPLKARTNKEQEERVKAIEGKMGKKKMKELRATLFD